MEQSTTIITDSNFSQYSKEIHAFFIPSTLGRSFTISWSGSGPLKKGGGYSRYSLEKKGRPVSFLEACSDGKKHFLHIYLIDSAQHKRWDEKIKKNKEHFSDGSRYYANEVSNCLDGEHFKAMDHRYLRFEIPKKLSAKSKKELSGFVDIFLAKIKNTGDELYFNELKDWFTEYFFG